jgi:hypothetical protein
MLLPDLLEVLIDQTHHMKAIGHDPGIGEVLAHDVSIGF